MLNQIIRHVFQPHCYFFTDPRFIICYKLGSSSITIKHLLLVLNLFSPVSGFALQRKIQVVVDI